MAGIGFELRQIFGRKTLLSSIGGAFYATFSTIGPTVSYIGLLFILRVVMNYQGVSEKESLFFVASFTYLFLTGILISAALNTVLARYISDKIFDNNEADISASLFGSLTLVSAVAGIVVSIMCYMMYAQDNIPLSFCLPYYLVGVLVPQVYVLMSYISAIKEYKQVSFSFLIGLIIAIPIFILLGGLTDLSPIITVYWALGAGLLFTSVLLLFLCLRAFGPPSKEYFQFLRTFVRFPKLFVGGFSYILGFYLTNIMYWNFSDMQVQISIFKITPSYDLAIFFAMVMNLSSMVLFVVKTETRFFEAYTNYLSALNKGTYQAIEKNLIHLQNTLKLQLFYIYDVQLIITILAICISSILLPYIGISSQIVNMAMLLALGVYATFCMYFTVVFLYYFEEHSGALLAPCIFLGTEIIAAYICAQCGSPYYPLALLIPAIISWIVGHIVLRWRLKHINAHLFCR